MRVWLIGLLTIYSNTALGDEFQEEIFIKHIDSLHLYTYFQFTTIVTDDSYEYSHLWPRSLGDVITRFAVDELHLTLTQGQWRHDMWGYPILDAASGAEVYAWFSPDVLDVDSNWKKLTSTLSGLFCASLNFIDESKTIEPKMILWPSGVSSHKHNTSHSRYASLPQEIVCTENLTPWKKLLPCESSKGFSTLLNSRMIHNTHYHSLGIHVRKICKDKDCLDTSIEIKQTVSLVYDYKMINARDWSFVKLFGQGLNGSCLLASASNIYVDITDFESSLKLDPKPDNVITNQRGGSESKIAVYNIKDNHNHMINIASKRLTQKTSVKILPPIYFNRYIVGYGKEFGGLVTEISNTYWAPINIVLMENAPWWFPIRLSSLRVNGEPESNLIKSQYFSPGRKREKPHHLELLLTLPPKSTTRVTLEFEFVFLKWQEYPPDANHGFYIGSSLITANLPTAKNYTSIPISGSFFSSMFNASQQWYPIVFRTNGAIISMPTPDFSMPYNVICLACTVVALAFGPLHNVCTKKLVLVDKTANTSFLGKVLNIFKKSKTE